MIMAMVIEGSLEVKLTCRKNASGCGAKHMWKSKWSKMSKHLTPRALLEVELFKKYTPFWRETHLQANSVKNWRSRTTFGRSDVEKVHGVVAWSTFRSQNGRSTPHSDHFWTFKCRFAWQAQWILHLAKRKQNVKLLWQLRKTNGL